MHEGWPSTITSLRWGGGAERQRETERERRDPSIRIRWSMGGEGKTNGTTTTALHPPVHTDRVRVAPRQQRCSRGAAELDDIVLLEPDAGQRELIDRWRVDRRADLFAVVTHVRVPQIIDQHKEDCERRPARSAQQDEPSAAQWSMLYKVRAGVRPRRAHRASAKDRPHPRNRTEPWPREACVRTYWHRRAIPPSVRKMHSRLARVSLGRTEIKRPRASSSSSSSSRARARDTSTVG